MSTSRSRTNSAVYSWGNCWRSNSARPSCVRACASHPPAGPRTKLVVATRKMRSRSSGDGLTVHADIFGLSRAACSVEADRVTHFPAEVQEAALGVRLAGSVETLRIVLQQCQELVAGQANETQRVGKRHHLEPIPERHRLPHRQPAAHAGRVDHREIHGIAVRPRLAGQCIRDEVGERRFPRCEFVAHRISAQIGIIRHAADDAVAIGPHAGDEWLHMLALEGLVNRQIDDGRQSSVRDNRRLPHRYVHLADELPELPGLHDWDAVDDVGWRSGRLR